ncbi:MAG: cupin [Ponticaulis sp.]|nr:cupin [Ponticaulis sp.]|tara:strand:- start:10069 stop:10518 length:450 start_codon:yes stop_codon:yes gene_type:complete
MSLARSGDLGVKEIIRMLDMSPHPEGGWFKETFRDTSDVSGRSVGTAIYFLLEAGDVSHWHRVDASEIWHWYAGGPLVLTWSVDGTRATSQSSTLGPDLRAGQRPQIVIPSAYWQTAETLGAWTLVGCTVAPGFEFSGFELAPPDWRPR